MDWLEEMLRFEEVADAIKRLVVDQDRAQQGLLRLDIVGRGTVGGCRFLPRLLAKSRIKRSHDVFANRLSGGQKTGRITPRLDSRRQGLCRFPRYSPRK